MSSRPGCASGPPSSWQGRASGNVLFKGLQGERLALQLGRQKFKDERRWLFDENPDGLRVFYRLPNLIGAFRAL